MKKSYDVIIISGAPGSGKTTISKILYEKLKHPPLIDFGILREIHLENNWSNKSKKEEQMSFENLIFILKNYIRHGYKNIIVNDLLDDKTIRLSKIFSKSLVVTLKVDDKELKRRVLSPRDSGFKNVKKAVEYNKKILSRKQLKNEIRMNNNHNNPEKTVMEILKLIK